MSESVLMAFDVRAQEEEAVVVIAEPGRVTLRLEDGRSLLIDARELLAALVDADRSAA